MPQRVIVRRPIVLRRPRSHIIVLPSATHGTPSASTSFGVSFIVLALIIVTVAIICGCCQRRKKRRQESIVSPPAYSPQGSVDSTAMPFVAAPSRPVVLTQPQEIIVEPCVVEPIIVENPCVTLPLYNDNVYYEDNGWNDDVELDQFT